MSYIRCRLNGCWIYVKKALVNSLYPNNNRYAHIMSINNDILIDIPDDDLETLANMYQEKSDIAYASSTLRIGKRFRKERKNLITFMSPGNCWKEDGTFFALAEFPRRHALLVFTLDSSGKNVYEGLTKTNRIHFKSPLLFESIHRSIYPTVLKVIEDKNIQVRWDDPANIFSLSRDQALKFNIECPKEVEIKKLDVSHSDLINSVWPNRFPNSTEFVSFLIKTNGGYGLFLKSTNELISWAIKTELGMIGISQTAESYQRSGYSTLVIKKLAKEIAEEHENPTVFSKIENVAVQKFAEKLKFRHVGFKNSIYLQ